MNNNQNQINYININSSDLNEEKLSFSVLFTRSFILFLSPLLFHTIDIILNQEALIHAYENKPWKLYILWTMISYPLFGFLYELICPQASEDLLNEEEATSFQDTKSNAWISLLAGIFAVFLMYLLLFRKIFQRRKLRTKSQ